MRELTTHVVPGDSANHQIKVEVMDEPGQGNACHAYKISNFDSKTNPSDLFAARYGVGSTDLMLVFQNGPIKLVGVNGITHEALLAVLVDRLEGFQSGEYANADNDIALYHLRSALVHLQLRTRARIARGVEGTHEK